MHVEFDDDVRALKDQARRLLAEHGALAAARRVIEAGEPFAAELWREVAVQGWCGITLAETDGGVGLGMIALSGLAEELGRSLAPTPFASSVYGLAEAVRLAGGDLPGGVASGERIGTLALVEGPGAPFAGPLASGVENGRLTGFKRPVIDGMVADLAVVLADGEAGPTLYLADLAQRGVTRTPVSTLDPSRPAAMLAFDGVPVAPLGTPGDGVRFATAILDRLAVPLAFEAVGGAEACLAMSVEHVSGRYAFGRPLGGYQAIKHRLAEMYVKIEMARSNAYFAAWAADHDPAAAPRAAAAARIAATDAHWFAAKEAIQLHGGTGFTWAMDCHLHYRRALHLGALAGPAAWWKARLAEALRREAA